MALSINYNIKTFFDDTLKTFSLHRGSLASKPRDCGFESNHFFLISLFLNFNWIVVKIWLYWLLDFDFCIAGFLHELIIEYRIKRSTVTYPFFDSYVYLSSFYQTVLWSIFLVRNHDLLHIKTVDYYFQFCTFCVNFLCKDILFMHKTYRPSIVLLQFKDLISENMKISK